MAAAVFAFFALVMPVYDDIRAAQIAVADRKEMLTRLENALSRIQDLKLEMDKFGADVGKAGGIIADKRSGDEVLMAMDTIANQSGMQLSRIAMSEGGLGGRFKVSNVDLSVKGTYLSFKLFLEGLERNIRLFDVQSVNIGESSTAGVLTFNMVINIYHLE